MPLTSGFDGSNIVLELVRRAAPSARNPAGPGSKYTVTLARRRPQSVAAALTHIGHHH